MAASSVPSSGRGLTPIQQACRALMDPDFLLNLYSYKWINDFLAVIVPTEDVPPSRTSYNVFFPALLLIPAQDLWPAHFRPIPLQSNHEMAARLRGIIDSKTIQVTPLYAHFLDLMCCCYHRKEGGERVTQEDADLIFFLWQSILFYHQERIVRFTEYSTKDPLLQQYVGVLKKLKVAFEEKAQQDQSSESYINFGLVYANCLRLFYHFFDGTRRSAESFIQLAPVMQWLAQQLEDLLQCLQRVEDEQSVKSIMDRLDTLVALFSWDVDIFIETHNAVDRAANPEWPILPEMPLLRDVPATVEACFLKQPRIVSPSFLLAWAGCLPRMAGLDSINPRTQQLDAQIDPETCFHLQTLSLLLEIAQLQEIEADRKYARVSESFLLFLVDFWQVLDHQTVAGLTVATYPQFVTKLTQLRDALAQTEVSNVLAQSQLVMAFARNPGDGLLFVPQSRLRLVYKHQFLVAAVMPDLQELLQAVGLQQEAYAFLNYFNTEHWVRCVLSYVDQCWDEYGHSDQLKICWFKAQMNSLKTETLMQFHQYLTRQTSPNEAIYGKNKIVVDAWLGDPFIGVVEKKALVLDFYNMLIPYFAENAERLKQFDNTYQQWLPRGPEFYCMVLRVLQRMPENSRLGYYFAVKGLLGLISPVECQEDSSSELVDPVGLVPVVERPSVFSWEYWASFFSTPVSSVPPPVVVTKKITKIVRDHERLLEITATYPLDSLTDPRSLELVGLLLAFPDYVFVNPDVREYFRRVEPLLFEKAARNPQVGAAVLVNVKKKTLLSEAVRGELIRVRFQSWVEALLMHCNFNAVLTLWEETLSQGLFPKNEIIDQVFVLTVENAMATWTDDRVRQERQALLLWACTYAQGHPEEMGFKTQGLIKIEKSSDTQLKSKDCTIPQVCQAIYLAFETRTETFRETKEGLTDADEAFLLVAEKIRPFYKRPSFWWGVLFWSVTITAAVLITVYCAPLILDSGTTVGFALHQPAMWLGAAGAFHGAAAAGSAGIGAAIGWAVGGVTSVVASCAVLRVGWRKLIKWFNTKNQEASDDEPPGSGDGEPQPGDLASRDVRSIPLVSGGVERKPFFDTAVNHDTIDDDNVFGTPCGSPVFGAAVNHNTIDGDNVFGTPCDSPVPVEEIVFDIP